jgi:hypothetical protein
MKTDNKSTAAKMPIKYCLQKLTFCQATQGRCPLRIITKRRPERQRPGRAGWRRRVGHGARLLLLLLAATVPYRVWSDWSRRPGLWKKSGSERKGKVRKRMPRWR